MGNLLHLVRVFIVEVWKVGELRLIEQIRRIRLIRGPEEMGELGGPRRLRRMEGLNWKSREN